MITFGLVNIPVKLYSAAEEAGIDFDMLHRKDLSPIRYARICEATGDEVPYKDIVKGYQYEKGRYVVVGPDDFRRARPAKTQTVDVHSFVDESKIDVKLLEKPFYIEPASAVKKAYVLLREALKRSKKVGIATFVLRSREHMALLKAEGAVLILDRMRFASQIRDASGLDLPPASEKVPERELELALQLIGQRSEPFDPERYRDTYTETLKRVIMDKVHGKEKEVQPAEVAPTKVPDLLSKLKESLEYTHTG
jgi:DNA end-binding protein Ku